MLDEREAPVASHERHRAFNNQSIGTRIAVVVAGPLANFLFAIVAYWIMFMVGVGGPRAVLGEVQPGLPAAAAGLLAGSAIVAVNEKETLTWEAVVQATVSASLSQDRVRFDLEDESGRRYERTVRIPESGLDRLTRGEFFELLGVEPGHPPLPPVLGFIESGARADAAGLRSGDRILAADGVRIKDWASWVDFVRARPERTMSVEIERAGRSQILQLTPARVETETAVIGRIGAGVYNDEAVMDWFFVQQRYGALEALPMAFDKTGEVSMLTLRLFWKMLNLEVSVKNLSGPITIAQYAGRSAELGIERFLQFLAVVSVSLGILNLLPVPVLDGGHLIFYIVEWIKGKPLSERAQILGHQVGIVLLVGLMSLAFYNDISRLLG
jgi:regulator of sigma E protease